MKNKEQISSYAKTHTMKECAEHFNTNIKTMRSYMSYNNIDYKKEVLSYNIEKLQRYAVNHTIKECAEYFNVSYKALEHYMNRHKIEHMKEREYLKQSGTRLYRIYRLIKDRCSNKNNPKYYDYGGRGILLCIEWKNSFKCFYKWAMQNGYKEDLTIDRIDVNGDYCPDNCRWIPFSEQGMNKRSTIYISYKGENKPLVVWSKELNINYATLLYNYHKSKDIEKWIESKLGE